MSPRATSKTVIKPIVPTMPRVKLIGIPAASTTRSSTSSPRVGFSVRLVITPIARAAIKASTISAEITGLAGAES